MAYQESVVSSITEIPALIATFAAANGWTVSGANYTRPGGGITFVLDATISGAAHTLSWTQGTESARIISPRLNGTSETPVTSIPSKVHLFAATTPQPFIAIVVEYGFNSYRHLYLGNMVKAGAYTGGEVIAGTQVPASNSIYAYPTFWRAVETALADAAE